VRFRFLHGKGNYDAVLVVRNAEAWSNVVTTVTPLGKGLQSLAEPNNGGGVAQRDLGR
jgi:hypothetical protein